MLLLFEVPRAVPTIGLALRSRRVAHDPVEHRQDGNGERQYTGKKDQSLRFHVSSTPEPAFGFNFLYSGNLYRS